MVVAVVMIVTGMVAMVMSVIVALVAMIVGTGLTWDFHHRL